MTRALVEVIGIGRKNRELKSVVPTGSTRQMYLLGYGLLLVGLTGGCQFAQSAGTAHPSATKVQTSTAKPDQGEEPGEGQVAESSDHLPWHQEPAGATESGGIQAPARVRPPEVPPIPKLPPVPPLPEVDEHGRVKIPDLPQLPDSPAVPDAPQLLGEPPDARLREPSVVPPPQREQTPAPSQ